MYGNNNNKNRTTRARPTIRATTSTTRRSRARARRAARPARTAAPGIRAWTRLVIIWIIRLMRGMLLSTLSLSLSLFFFILSFSLVCFVCLIYRFHSSVPLTLFLSFYLFWFFSFFLSFYSSPRPSVLPTLPYTSHPVSATFLTCTSESLSGCCPQGEKTKQKQARKKEAGRKETPCWEKKDSSYHIHFTKFVFFLFLFLFLD